ncbi:MAG: prephenate dehydrogenase [Chloroflexi bacterium]|nr:prephenate dehydrogenase [Chloroflexota bacterium]
MTTISVAIIGLGRIGTSVGLALKRYNASKNSQQQFEITGFDTLNANLKNAKDTGAIDGSGRGVDATAEGKDIVVLALPYGEVEGALRLMGESLRPGAVVLDFATLKRPSLAWAGKHLADESHLVGVTAVLNPKYLFDGLDDAEHAAADLFDKGGMLLAPGVKCAKEAVELAADFTDLIGATTYFADPTEHDSWIAGTEALPAALGAAFYHTLSQHPGWGDIQRTGNPSFGRLTHHLADTHPDDLRDLLLASREDLARQIDALTETLTAMRQILAANDQDTLEALLVNAAETYEQWYARRQRGRWQEDDTGAASETRGGAIMTGLLGSYLSRRISGDKNDNNKA